MVFKKRKKSRSYKEMTLEELIAELKELNKKEELDGVQHQMLHNI